MKHNHEVILKFINLFHFCLNHTLIYWNLMFSFQNYEELILVEIVPLFN